MSKSNQKQSLFSKQTKIYPKRTWGRYRKLKWLAMFLTLGIYYLSPWLRWDRGLNAPDQAILIDIKNSKAYFFFLEIWAQEIFYIAIILIFLAVLLFLLTSLFGRIWCGYSCPQTIWTDLFVWVERIFQGDRNARMKLDQQKLSFNKLWKKTVTHLTWIIIGLLTGGAWVFYFNDAPTLLNQFIHFQASWDVLLWVLALTLSTYVLAGFAREQVCTYMCPYARFQSAMFDPDSLIIGYDERIGETRGKHKKGETWDNRGHCIDCKACVQVCPTGIDIRDGLQMECIACGLCIDACDDIMEKLELPKNLIRYDTINNQISRKHNKPQKSQILRTRTFYYSAILVIALGIIIFGLFNRQSFDLHSVHKRNPLFVKLSDGSIRNSYNLSILNKTLKDQDFSISIKGLQNYSIKIQGLGNVNKNNFLVIANSIQHLRVFVTATKYSKDLRQVIYFELKNKNTGEIIKEENFFIFGKN